jgi:large subunit ribosomal protein L10
MPNEIKRLLTAEIARDLEGVQDMLLVDASRLTAVKSGELRGKLEEMGIRLRVVRNSLAVYALREAGLPPMDEVLQGATAILVGSEGAGRMSKALVEWNKKEIPVEVKGGLLEGKVGNKEDVLAWASLPTRPELLCAILTGILAPAAGVGGAFQATLAQFANLVAAHIEKMEKDSE